MRIALIYPVSACSRPISPEVILTSPRGLTGSEAAWYHAGVELRAQGHEVILFGNFDGQQPESRHENDWTRYCHRERWDAVVSYIRPEPLRLVPLGVNARRVYVQQCNDFLACEPGWEGYVDYLVACSATLLQRLLGMCSIPAERGRVLHNGHDAKLNGGPPREQRRMLWASSADRGLHWAIQVAQQLRQSFVDPKNKVIDTLTPELRVAYDQSGMRGFAQLPDSPEAGSDAMRELGRRSRYCLSALERKLPGITSLGSVSRVGMVEEMQRANVLLYPCDPVSFTEGFSNTVLEALAYGCVPVLNFVDAFPELWKGACPGVEPIEAFTADGSRHPRAFMWREKQYVSDVRKLLIGAPVGGKTANEWRKVGYERAELFRWSRILPAFGAFLGGRDDALPTFDRVSYPWH